MASRLGPSPPLPTATTRRFWLRPWRYLKALGSLPERTSVHLDRGYDSDLTRKRLEERGLISVISEKGKPAPLQATKRWVVERTSS